MDSNGVPSMDGNSDPYMVSQSDAHSTYHTAEYLAQNDHGMMYKGGIHGGWTHPITGNPLTAAAYMQVSADLRAQTNAYHGGADPGHAAAQHAAQLAANGIRNVQSTIASINYQPCNSSTVNYSQTYEQQEQLKIYNLNQAYSNFKSLGEREKYLNDKIKNAPYNSSYENERMRNDLFSQLCEVQREKSQLSYNYDFKY